MLTAKFDPDSPREYRYLPQTPIRFGPQMTNKDAKDIAERRQARLSVSMTPTKPLGKFESLCGDSKAILGNMAGMFSPAKTQTLEEEPQKIEMEIPPIVSPVKKARNKKDRRDDHRKKGQPRRKKVINPAQVRRRVRPPADPTPEGVSRLRR